MAHRKIVNHHAGQLLVESETRNEFLCNVYDNTHPIKFYREKINFLGGGKAKPDISPLATVQREICEEFSLSKNLSLDEAVVQDSGRVYALPKIGKMANLEDIEIVRKEILENTIPYQDFLVNFSPVENGPKLQVPRAIFSVFYSKLPKEIFETIRRNLVSGKSLVNDGFLKIVTIDDLISGNPLAAWACGRTFEYHLKKKIPNPENTVIQPLGKPRNSYSQYLMEFEYVRF